MAPRLTQAQKSLALRLHRQGLNQSEIARLNRTGFDGDSQLVSSISEVSLMVAS